MNANKLNDRELISLINLIDDEDKDIFNHVNNKILEQGYSAVPLLINALSISTNIIEKERLDSLIEKLKYDNLQHEITEWKRHDSNDLLKGCIAIARYAYPDLNEEEIIESVNELYKKIEAEIKQVKPSRVEIVKALNKVILSDYQFKGNKRNYSGINNSFINKVIEDRVGNPIMLSVIYLLVAKKFNIPLIGINSPGHFILAYINPLIDINKADKNELMDNLLFYLSPFYEGAMFQPADFDKMLSVYNLTDFDKNELPANNVDIIKLIMNNVIFAIDQNGDKNQALHLLEIIEKL